MPTNIGALQCADLSLKPLFDKACAGGISLVSNGDKPMYVENGILYMEGADYMQSFGVTSLPRHPLSWTLAQRKTFM